MIPSGTLSAASNWYRCLVFSLVGAFTDMTDTLLGGNMADPEIVNYWFGMGRRNTCAQEFLIMCHVLLANYIQIATFSIVTLPIEL